MKIIYDSETDTLSIRLTDYPVEESDENTPGVILDYDKGGNLVGLEIPNASQRVDNLKSIEFSITD